jgi:hypothetical protein
MGSWGIGPPFWTSALHGSGYFDDPWSFTQGEKGPPRTNCIVGCVDHIAGLDIMHIMLPLPAVEPNSSIVQPRSLVALPTDLHKLYGRS